MNIRAVEGQKRALVAAQLEREIAALRHELEVAQTRLEGLAALEAKNAKLRARVDGLAGLRGGSFALEDEAAQLRAEVESLRSDNAAMVGLCPQLAKHQEQVVGAELRAARAKASTDELVHADLQVQLSGEREQTAGLRSQLEELRQQLHAATPRPPLHRYGEEAATAPACWTRQRATQTRQCCARAACSGRSPWARSSPRERRPTLPLPPPGRPQLRRCSRPSVVCPAHLPQRRCTAGAVQSRHGPAVLQSRLDAAHQQAEPMRADRDATLVAAERHRDEAGPAGQQLLPVQCVRSPGARGGGRVRCGH